MQRLIGISEKTETNRWVCGRDERSLRCGCKQTKCTLDQATSHASPDSPPQFSDLRAQNLKFPTTGTSYITLSSQLVWQIMVSRWETPGISSFGPMLASSQSHCLSVGADLRILKLRNMVRGLIFTGIQNTANSFQSKPLPGRNCWVFSTTVTASLHHSTPSTRQGAQVKCSSSLRTALLNCHILYQYKLHHLSTRALCRPRVFSGRHTSLDSRMWAAGRYVSTTSSSNFWQLSGGITSELFICQPQRWSCDTSCCWNHHICIRSANSISTIRVLTQWQLQTLV